MKTISIMLLGLMLALSGCKKGDDTDVLPSSTLPANYSNQGTLTVKSNTLKICLWDWSVVDGNVIDLLVNGKKLLSNYELTANQKCIDVKLPDGESWIGIIAINEGYNPPASPVLNSLTESVRRRSTFWATSASPAGTKSTCASSRTTRYVPPAPKLDKP